MDQVHMILDQLGELDAVLQGLAALHPLGAGHTVLDQEIVAADFPDPVADHDGEPGAVFHGAAEFIGAVVEPGRNELIEQPAVGAVETYHLEAQGLAVPGGLGEVVDGLHNLLPGHLLHLDAVLPQVGAGADGVLVTLDGVGVVHGAHVVELDGGHGAVGPDGLGKDHDGLHVEGGHVPLVDVETVLMPPGVGVVDEGLGQGDGAETAPGLGLVDVDALGGGIAVVHDPVGGDGRGEHPVFEGDALDGHGLEHIGILAAGHLRHFLSHASDFSCVHLNTFLRLCEEGTKKYGCYLQVTGSLRTVSLRTSDRRHWCGNLLVGASIRFPRRCELLRRNDRVDILEYLFSRCHSEEQSDEESWHYSRFQVKILRLRSGYILDSNGRILLTFSADFVTI